MQSRAPFLAAIAFLAFLAGLTGVRLAYTLSYLLVLLLVVAFIWSRALGRRLRIERQSPSGTFSVGEPFVEQFVAHNGSALPLPYCEVLDRSAIPGYVASRVIALGGNDSISWTARGAFDRRGRHTLGPLEARYGDPFGLFPRRFRVAGSTDVLVHPALHPVDDVVPSWGGSSAGDSTRGQFHDVPPEVSTVREYSPEDGLGRIHWRSTARTGRLMSRTYETHESSDLLIVLDLERDVHAGSAPESTLEYAVSLAASITHMSLRSGRAVGLVCNDAAATAMGAGRGETQRLRILDYLAVAQADGGLDIAQTIARHGSGWRGRGGLVIITPNRAPAWVDATLDASSRGLRHLCIAIDATSFGAEGTALRISAAWRMALDWRVVRRGDALSFLLSAHAAGF